MKYLFFISICILTLVSFTPPNETISRYDLSGKWDLSIDNTIDGHVSGNNGCSGIEFSMKEDLIFSGRYTFCGDASEKAVDSKFSVTIYLTNRGNMVHIHQDNFDKTRYYASWVGNFTDADNISGIWTDIEGNRGEFKLSR